MFSVGGRSFALVRGSDIIRDGMYLEMTEEGARTGIAEVFYSDASRNLVLNTFGNDVPLEAIEWIITQAKTALPS